MRVVLLVLMMALLPLRGWVGNAMAVDMAAAQAHATMQSRSSTDVAGSAAMPEDCPMHMAAGTGDAAPAVGTPQKAGGHCQACDTCELCLALASFSIPLALAHSPAPSAGPLTEGVLFSSADHATGLKPPIS